MSPRKSRRRRIFAAPFVLTTALSAGCVVKEAPPPQAQTQPETRYDQDGNEVTTKPIPPGPAQPAGSGSISEGNGSEGNGSDTKLPPVVVNPPPPDTLPDAPTDAKGKLVTRDDGTCWFHYTIECPPKATCNPPPPKQVKCDK